MVSAKNRDVKYTSNLKSMVEFLKKSLSKSVSETHKEEILNGILEFCHNYPKKFREKFIRKVGIKEKSRNLLRKSDENILNQFTNHLSKQKGECVFLLRDSYNSLKEYQNKTNKGFGILINRNYLFEKEEDYFLLIDIFYKSLLKSDNKRDFLRFYLGYFKDLLKNNQRLLEKSREVFQFIDSNRNENKIIWVDMGFQFTFCLFGYFSMLIHSRIKIEQDFILFSTYPWLREAFQENYFSENNEYVLDLEEKSIEKYEKSLLDKSSGCLLGFAIGDSLGFPVAGIDKRDVRNFSSSGINGFEDNPKHPFFSHLKKGQYTDNTNLLIVSTESLTKNNGFDIEKYPNELANWLEQSKEKRWLGPTALKGITRLIEGKSYKYSGSKTTKSCSSSYRVIPLGIYYKDNLSKLIEYSNISSGITHNSDISKDGSLFVSLTIANLIKGNLPKKSILSSLEYVKNKTLKNKIKKAIDFIKKETISKARKEFGTGSNIDQTLPLVIYCFLRNPDNFEKSILLAANSFRDDTKEEKERLKGLSWEEQILECKGGNTDGIAGLTGAFLGAYLGKGKIPKKFLNVENNDKISKRGKELIKSYSS